MFTILRKFCKTCEILNILKNFGENTIFYSGTKKVPSGLRVPSKILIETPLQVYIFSRCCDDLVVCLVLQAAVRRKYLFEKYFYRWKDKAFHITRSRSNTFLSNPQWLKHVLFNSGSRHARQVACNLVQSVCSTPVHQKKVTSEYYSLIRNYWTKYDEFCSVVFLRWLMY